MIGAHGIAGEVKLKVFAEDLAAYPSFNGGTLTLAGLRQGTIARFEGVTDRNAAEALRGVALTVPRDALPPLGEGEYYYFDLIGLLAATDTGEPAGHVVGVENFGAGDILDIEKPGGGRFMVPVALVTIGETVIVPSEFMV